jgi:transcriptional regulator with GAF, ATPase, and Fis domain
MEKREPFAGSCLDDYRDHPESHNVLAQEGIESICAVPLIGSETCIGVLVLYAKAPDNFRPEDVELVSNVADAIAIGLDRCLVHERVEQLKQRLELENVYLQEEISLHQNFENIIGRSTSIMETLEAVETVAPTHANVLITGETGTGKELVARAVHDLSERSDRPLIKVNCATIPKDLFESEFFGHVKGAFTGALKTRAGRFELADKGTLFLDEVGEIPIEMQSKLLRVLQEGEFERVGEERTRRVDVRIIAATNRDLNEEVVNGRFRQDLYYRLNVFPIHVAPLRERPADLPLLAAHFLERAAAEMGRNTPTFSEHDMAMLRSYDWPGNVRELQNVIERAVISSRGGKLRVDLPSGEQQREATTGEEIGGAQAPSDTAHTAEDVSLAAIEKQHILRVLDINEGNKAKTARELGIDPKTLYKRLREYGLLPPRE